MKISQLLVAITFHFVEERLKYLEAVTGELPNLAEHVRLVIVTNTNDPQCHQKIRSILPTSSGVEIFVPVLLGHPYLLTWSHFEIFRRYYSEFEDISHFLYLEDDTLVRKENIDYWLRGRSLLSNLHIIPSFLRYEVPAGSFVKVSTDVTARVRFSLIPKVKMSSQYYYVNLPEPYQGMYLLDRVLAGGHLFGPSSSPDFGRWPIREKAAQGITFHEVPTGCFSRNFLGVDMSSKTIDSGALLHHLPNNYADAPETKFGKIPVEEIFIFSSFFDLFERKTRSQEILKIKRTGIRLVFAKTVSLIRRLRKSLA